MSPLAATPTARNPTVLPATVVLAAATLAAYADGLRGPFIFDDTSSIAGNPTIRSLWPPWAPLVTPVAGGLTVTSRPILNLSFALDYAVGRNAVWIYHATNVAIHALAALLLFGIVRRTLAGSAAAARRAPHPARAVDPAWVAFAAALLWALHPLQTEAVTYVVQRAESLMGLLLLLTLYCFIRGASGGTRSAPWLALSCLACLLGMGTKEVMAVAPVLMLLYDRTFLSGSFRRAVAVRPRYYAALAATWVPLAALVARAGGNRAGSIGFGIGVGFWTHLLTQFSAVSHYLRLAIWPRPLVLEYAPVWIGSVGQAALPAAVVLALLAGTALAVARRSAAGFLGAWFFAILAPTSLMPSPSEFTAEYRMYLPLAAVAVLAAATAARVAGVRGTRILAAAALGLGCLTARRNRDYRSAVAIWADTVAKQPGNALAHEMLGQALDESGRGAEALAEHQEAVSLRPGLGVAQVELAADLLRAGRIEEAMAHDREALRLKPDSVDALDGLGLAFAAQGRPAVAAAEFAAAVRVAPDFAPAHYNLAGALGACGRDAEAIAEYRDALRLMEGAREPAAGVPPGEFDARYNLANTLALTGDRAAAIAEYRRALAADPRSAEAHYNLANSLAATGRTKEAIAEYEDAIRLNPDFADAECNLAAALVGQGRTAEAIPHYRAALRLRSDFADVREALKRLGAPEKGPSK